MAKTETKTTYGLGLPDLLGVLFVGLKLGHVINWSWWWVTLPFWFGLGLVLLILVVGLIGAGLVAAFKS